MHSGDRMPEHRKSRLRRWYLPCLVLLTALAASEAAAWSEKPFDPKAGSRWLIVSELDRTETRVENGRRSMVALKKITRTELVFNAKLPDGGYRISFTRRATVASGDPREAALARIEGETMNNVAIRAVTDRNGKPLRVENLDEILARRKELVDRLATTVDAETAAVARRMLEGLTKVSDVEATRQLTDMEMLAMAQNSGLRPGETRNSTLESPSGIGPPLVKSREFSILQTDAATGNALMLLKESYTEESMREFLAVITRRSLGPGKATDERESDMRRMKMSFDNRFEIGVVDGMSRSLDATSTTSSDLLGNTMVIKDQRKVRISPL